MKNILKAIRIEKNTDFKDNLDIPEYIQIQIDDGLAKIRENIEKSFNKKHGHLVLKSFDATQHYNVELCWTPYSDHIDIDTTIDVLENIYLTSISSNEEVITKLSDIFTICKLDGFEDNRLDDLVLNSSDYILDIYSNINSIKLSTFNDNTITIRIIFKFE